MIDKVGSPRVDESPMSSVVRHVDVPKSHPAFAGHFPSHPMLPGAAVLCEVLETALADHGTRASLGDSPVIEQAKFLAPVEPGSRLTITLHSVLRAGRASIDFSAHDQRGIVVARGQLSPQRPEAGA